MDVMAEHHTSRPISMQELYDCFIDSVEQYIKYEESSHYYRLKGFIDGLKWSGIIDNAQSTIFTEMLSDAHDLVLTKKDLYKRLEGTLEIRS